MKFLLSTALVLLLISLGAQAQTVQIINCPSDFSFSHCDNGAYLFYAESTIGGPITYELVSGPGEIEAETGLWSWSGPSVPQSGSFTLEVRAIDPTGPGPVCTVEVEVTNEAPTITCPMEPRVAAFNLDSRITVETEDPDDCDELIMQILGWTDQSLYPDDQVWIEGSYVYFRPSLDRDESEMIFVTVEVSDGETTDLCEVVFALSTYAPPIPVIDVDHAGHVGQISEVDIILYGVSIFEGIGGFDLMLGYDATDLAVYGAPQEGEVYSECGWDGWIGRIIK